MKRIPWLSSALLLVAYSSFSWFLYQATATWIVWLISLGFALTQALLLTAFSKGLRFFVKGWLKSDIGYFSIISIGAFSIAAVLVWIHVFEYVLMLIAAEVLARVDLQNSGFNQWQALGVLTSISILGLSVGYVAQELPLEI